MGDQGRRIVRNREDATFDAQDLRGRFDRLGFRAEHVRERGQEEIAEVVPRDIAFRETIPEELADER